MRFNFISCLLSDWALIRQIEMLDLHRVRSAFGHENRTAVQILGDWYSIQGRRHDADLEVRPIKFLDLFGERERNIAEQVAFMKFVEQDDADVTQLRIISQTTGVKSPSVTKQMRVPRLVWSSNRI